MHLTLLSTIPSVPLELLSGILDEIRGIIIGEEEEQKREELVEALFKEIEEGVGDREKEYVVWWWGRFREELGDHVRREEEQRQADAKL